jgi:hypothetical protein
MVGITSPGDELNYVCQLQELKRPDGRPLFHNIRIGTMCEKCVTAGLDNCKHEIRRLPKWKSESRHDLERAVYGQNKEAMMREVGGMIVSNRTYLFGKHDVNVLAERYKADFGFVHGIQGVQLIEVGIDPSGGGSQSDYTIVSRCIDGGRDVVSRQSETRKHLAHACDVMARAA